MRVQILFFHAVLMLIAPLTALASNSNSTIDVALTFDDLPWVGAPPAEGTITEAVQRMAAVLNVHDAPATGFVVCERFAENPAPVVAWADWGYDIGNHSTSHRDLDNTDTAEWIADIVDCHEELKEFANYRGLFRFPMLHQGRSTEKRDAVATALAEEGMRNAHVTVDTSDWIIAQYHAQALASNDAVGRRKVGEAFIEHVLAAIRHADRVARRKAGRPTPQVLLLHSNSLVEDYLDELLLTLREEGVRFISVEQALDDPVFARQDGYVGPKGLSWLYRMHPASPGDVEWDESEAARLREQLQSPAEGRKETSISAVPVNRLGDALIPALEEAGSSERWRSLLISKEGELLLEAYFNGVDQETPANLKSVTKTLTSALTGVALQEGWIRSLSDHGAAYLPAYEKAFPREPIELKALLTMSTGMRPVNYAFLQQQQDWVATVLAAGRDPEGRGRFEYDTPVLQLLTAVLRQASGRSSIRIANEHLFVETTERIRYWRKGPKGLAFGGNDAYLTPRGMLAFGELMLNKGMADGRQILPAEYVEQSLNTQIKPRADVINHETLPVRGYGYLWWLTRMAGEDAAAALGHGGQMIYVIPSRDTVVVVTSRWPMASSTGHYRHVTRMLNDVFLPAAWRKR